MDLKKDHNQKHTDKCCQIRQLTTTKIRKKLKNQEKNMKDNHNCFFLLLRQKKNILKFVILKKKQKFPRNLKKQKNQREPFTQQSVDTNIFNNSIILYNKAK